MDKFRQTVTLSKEGDIWGTRIPRDRKMPLLDAIHWLTRYHYTARQTWTKRNGDRVIRYTKPHTVTEYRLTIHMNDE